MEEAIKKTWTNVLTKILKVTYDDILSLDEITNRINFIITNIKSIPPEALYKCILYNDINFEVSKIAIDYRIKFASNDYESVIRTGASYEIDNNDSYKKCVINDIENTLMQINHVMLVNILKNKENIIHDEKDELKKIFGYKIHDLNTNVWCLCDDMLYYMSQNQACYSAVYGVNILSGDKMLEEDIKLIKHSFPTLYSIFTQLKIEHPNGIDFKFIL